MKKKLIYLVAAGVLTFGSVGGPSIQTFATPNKSNIPNEELQENLDPETKQKADEIMSNLKTELLELGVTLPKMNQLYNGINEDKKEKAREILEKVKSGEITNEEAKEQLKELGVSEQIEGEGKPLSDLDEETREKAESLIEDAKIQLKEIGANNYYQILNHFSNK